MNAAKHWAPAMAGMVAGYWMLGPLGGFAGLGAGWWWARGQAKKRAATEQLPADLLAAYRTLGVSPTAAAPTVKTAYRRLINRHHPDKLPPDAGAPRRRKAAEQATTIRKAYERIVASRNDD